uniref:Putative secreted protein n=1 Tax=Anopheles marajoara TaxID=58244 RepID=A0A2M4CD83_9DIPT
MRCSERVCLWSVCVCVCVCTHPCPQPRKKVETFYKYTLELGFVCVSDWGTAYQRAKCAPVGVVEECVEISIEP